MHLLLTDIATISTGTWILLGLALLLALSFEFVNGFHDTANAVATIIYTKTLPAIPAVIWSGFFNFLGVLTSNGAVAFSIVALLPVELVIHIGSGPGFAMVFSLLISAIIWNVGTWYFGLPASSSHTLIGSIMGVGVANALMSGNDDLRNVANWDAAQKVGLGLLISPVIGFCLSALLLIILKIMVKNPKLFTSPEGHHKPPGWIRAILMFTCTGVSFAHGSNDGQKGMGLIMLILVAILPTMYAIKRDTSLLEFNALRDSIHKTVNYCSKHALGANNAKIGNNPSKVISDFIRKPNTTTPELFKALKIVGYQCMKVLDPVDSASNIPKENLGTLRANIYLISAAISKLSSKHLLDSKSDEKDAKSINKAVTDVTREIPIWVKVAVAIALGLGTMIGWKRIVVTVGEKIGKSHLTYGQGACAELVAMITIGLADRYGLPVSTTHVLSSGIAGTMAANGSGLQIETVRNIILAWVLTFPACIFLGAALFAIGLTLLAGLGIH